jgi:Ca-activated chloride channel homolog
MRSSVASVLFCVSLIGLIALNQTSGQTVKRSPSQTGGRKASKSQSGSSQASPARGGTLRICQGVDIPSGYVIVGYESSSACPHGAYVLKKDEDSLSQRPQAQTEQKTPSPQAAAVARPRRVGNTRTQAEPTEPSAPAAPKMTFEGATSNTREPTLIGTPLGGTPGTTSLSDLQSSGPEEVGEGDVVRIDTNLVTVPVSVLDRQGRFVPNIKRDEFTVLENGVEQKIAYFEPTEKPFTVALVLDTSGSTVFHLWEIKEAAIAFARQLRPQDRVLVVTFNQDVLLLTEATNDFNVVTEVIQQNANTGFSTRLYDAITLVINARLNKIKGRKAIVLFTDGVDTSSYLATYQSTLREAEELDALIYPIQYDTTDFVAATQGRSNVTVTTRTSNWPFPGRTSSRVIFGPPMQVPGSAVADYQLADQYLHGLADKTGAHLYKANDRTQLNEAFSKIAEELRCQYSLGYYPQTTVQGGDRRLIKVKVNRPDLAVRARDSYMQRVAPPPQP